MLPRDALPIYMVWDAGGGGGVRQQIFQKASLPKL